MADSTFFFHPVDEYEILDAIRILKNKTYPGQDCVSVRILKMIADDVADHLAHIVNLSVSSGVFPAILKHATVLPIFKRNDAYSISNYRPISILSVFSKVIERVVMNRMTNYLNKYNLISNCQHGFRAKRSTQTAAIHFFDHIYRSLDGGLCVCGIFFDLTRAVDCILPQFIISKLYNLGFRGNFLEWILSFLSNRTMSVKVLESFSGKYETELGVPQGSVLGPLLFILFINDLPSYIVNEWLVIFVDDTSVAVSAPSRAELLNRCETVVATFVHWCHSNALIVNVSKTESVIFELRNSVAEPLRLQYRTKELKSSDSTKFLGVYVDRNLRWCEHVDHVCGKLSSSFYAIRRIRDSLPFDAILNVYYSLCYSHIAYNILVWGNSIEFNRVFISQKRIMRMMFMLGYRDHCRPIFIANGILLVPCIFIFKSLQYVKENESLFVKLSSFHSYSTRSSETLFMPIHRTTKFESSPLYQIVKLYNHLPDSIKILDKLKFKNKIKSVMICRAYYSVREYLDDDSLLYLH